MVKEPDGQLAGAPPHQRVLVGVDDGVGPLARCRVRLGKVDRAPGLMLHSEGDRAEQQPSKAELQPTDCRTVGLQGGQEGDQATEKTGVSRSRRASSSPMATVKAMTGSGAQMFGPRKTWV